jgi:DNA-binding NarL/FixJ family response regulator/anti-sigma regulatory factor (Ser/Thr protein kinase)
MGHLLVAGADEPFVQALRQARSLDGHELQTCDSAFEVVRLARAMPIDVLITSPSSSLAEDLALVEEIKAVRSDVRVIVLSRAFTDSDVVRALRASVFACFSEPFDVQEIADMARSALAAENWRDGIQIRSGLPNWLTLRVACRLMTADRLTRFMTEWRGDLPSAERDLLMTAFREMLLNAMEHGAGFDPAKVIEVTAARTARAIVFHFRDPGNGFDQADLRYAAASNTAEGVIATTVKRADAGLRPGGFGMLIVRQIVDELVYNEHGNEVILIKHIA